MRILFVCYGNTFRSPMAEGLGRYHLNDVAEVESAGLHASFSRAAEEAIDLLKRYYDVDISSHQPRSVSEVDLSRFDWIVALDESVAQTLKRHYQVSEEKLFLWEIPDPIGGTITDYERAMNLIEKKLLDLKKRISLK